MSDDSQTDGRSPEDQAVAASSRWLSLKGRLRRSAYWKKTLLVMLLAFVATIPVICGATQEALSQLVSDSGQIHLEALTGTPAEKYLYLVGAVGLCCSLLMISITVRRLHDLNLSGWWYLVFWLGGMLPTIGPLVSLVAFVLIGCTEGTRGPNAFGPDPKARAHGFEPPSPPTPTPEAEPPPGFGWPRKPSAS